MPLFFYNLDLISGIKDNFGVIKSPTDLFQIYLKATYPDSWNDRGTKGATSKEKSLFLKE